MSLCPLRTAKWNQISQCCLWCELSWGGQICGRDRDIRERESPVQHLNLTHTHVFAKIMSSEHHVIASSICFLNALNLKLIHVTSFTLLVCLMLSGCQSRSKWTGISSFLVWWLLKAVMMMEVVLWMRQMRGKLKTKMKAIWVPYKPSELSEGLSNSITLYSCLEYNRIWKIIIETFVSFVAIIRHTQEKIFSCYKVIYQEFTFTHIWWTLKMLDDPALFLNWPYSKTNVALERVEMHNSSG